MAIFKCILGIKLQCAVVDDDPLMIEVIRDYCKDSPFVQLANTFTSSREFIASARTMAFDFCLLDIVMPEMDGLAVAKIITFKPIIFMTGAYEVLKDALDVAPVDILTKPFQRQRLEVAFDKVSRYLGKRRIEKSHDLFKVAEGNDRRNICLADILFVKSDDPDPRNKHIVLKGGESLTFMKCPFERLLSSCPNLVKVNRTHVISVEVVKEVRHDLITLKNIEGRGISFQLTLSDTCRRNFMQKLSSY